MLKLSKNYFPLSFSHLKSFFGQILLVLPCIIVPFDIVFTNPPNPRIKEHQQSVRENDYFASKKVNHLRFRVSPLDADLLLKSLYNFFFVILIPFSPLFGTLLIHSYLEILTHHNSVNGRLMHLFSHHPLKPAQQQNK